MSRAEGAASVIEVENLHVNLAGREVLGGGSAGDSAGVDLVVHAGEFVGLLGPNGAGKTTLMRAILGLLPSSGGKTRGTVTTKGYVGYVPQRHEVEWGFPISVRDAVLSGRTGLVGWLRRPSRLDREAAERAVAHVGLTELAKRPIGELSGGQRQRVLIARALATEPSVLLLDEPFTGLDAPNTDALLVLFGELAAAGTAIVMSTHNLAEAVHTCPRLVLLGAAETGQSGIVADGPAGELLADASVWTRTFGVGIDSPLLRSLGVQTEEAAAC